MRYLPNSKDLSGDRFWTQLPDEIRRHLLEITPALWTKSHRKLCCIGMVRRLPPRMLDLNWVPLFRDLEMEQYLASEYLPKDLDLLINYGLRQMNEQEFLDRVYQDLNVHEFSIMKSPSTDEDWHSRVARILIAAWRDHSDAIKKLALIPLGGGEWTSSEAIYTTPVYYSHVNGYPIPPNPKLSLVDSRAEKNPHRQRLFDCLGVENARAPYVRRQIIDCHARYRFARSVSRMFLTFLYLTAHLDRENDDADAYREIKLVDHLSRNRTPQLHTLYFPDDDPYGAWQLLQPVDSGESHGGTPGLDVSFVHCDYMLDPPTQPEGEIHTWKTWLSEKRHIREEIPLTRGWHLSEECVYVAKHHPQKFIGFLLKYWKFEITGNQQLTNELLNLEVLCENGYMYPLAKTYVHTSQLEYADKFLQKDEFFPWLKQADSLSDNPGLFNLEFVAKALGFGYPKSELEFHLTILRFIVDANDDAKNLLDFGRIFILYRRIQARYQESATPNICHEMIRYVFASRY